MGQGSSVQPSTADLRQELEASRTILMDAIAGLDEESFRARPAPSEWTAAEVLAHLLHIEGVQAERVHAALTQVDFIATVITEEQCHEQAKLAQRMPVPQILHGLLARRRDTLRLLEGLSQQQLARSFQHPERGELMVGDVFQRIAKHEEEHAAQIRALRDPAAAPASQPQGDEARA